MDNILIVGSGHVGTGIFKVLESTWPNVKRLNSLNCDLFKKDSLKDYLKRGEFSLIILCAGVTGGVGENTENGLKLHFANNQINESILEGLKDYKGKVINLVPSCIYPLSIGGECMDVDSLGSGALESTSELFALTQIARMKLLINGLNKCNIDIINIIVTNVFGNKDSKSRGTHFLDQLLVKIISCSTNNSSSLIEMDGDGNSIRDYLYNIDLGFAISHVIENWSECPRLFNIAGMGALTTSDISARMSTALGFHDLRFKFLEKFAGAQSKILNDSSFRNIGWAPKYSYDESFQEFFSSYF